MKKCLNVKIITYLHYSETRLRTNHFSLTQTKTGVKGLNCSLYVYFQGSLISSSMSEILPILAFGITSVIAGFLALLLPETRNRYMPENIHDMKHLA